MEVNEAYQICKQIAKDNKLLPTDDILIAIAKGYERGYAAKLKEKIQGAIYVKVNENDSLVIKITRRDENNFDMSFTDFSNKFLNGFSTDYAAYEVTKKYQKFVMKQFSNELKGSAETSGLLFL